MSKKTNLTIHDFEVKKDDGFLYVPWQNIEEVMSEEMLTKFHECMYGQTCIANGAFLGDVERFLRGLPVID